MNPVRWSNLKYMADCPAVYKHVLDHGVAVTPAMRFGTLVHWQVLGVLHSNVVEYEGERRGNAWKDFKAANAGAEIVTSDEVARAKECAAAILADPVCGMLITSGVKEHRLTWEVGGRACSGTPDVNGGVLMDLKVTPQVNPFRFPHHARKMLWFAQVPWYKHGIEATGGKVEASFIITCTPKEPYLVVPYELTQQTLDFGTRTWRSLFERLMVCEASNEYPGYTQSAIPLDMSDDELTLTMSGEEVEW